MTATVTLLKGFVRSTEMTRSGMLSPVEIPRPKTMNHPPKACKTLPGIKGAAASPPPATNRGRYRKVYCEVIRVRFTSPCSENRFPHMFTGDLCGCTSVARRVLFLFGFFSASKPFVLFLDFDEPHVCAKRACIFPRRV